MLEYANIFVQHLIFICTYIYERMYIRIFFHTLNYYMLLYTKNLAQ